MFDLGWTLEDKKHVKAYEQLDSFFEYLHDNADKNIEGVKLTYRESQQRFASTVMEAIKEKNILLIQAGVGTGKSFGYLIPVFYTWDNVSTFNKVIISTSSMALQEQLIKDIDYVSELLGITIKRCDAKGINNYACIRRIEEKMYSALNHDDRDVYDFLLEMKKTMYKKGECDKTKLPHTKHDLWQDIRVCGGCENCSYKSECLFQEMRMRILTSSIVVTNHTQFGNMIKNRDEALSGASLVVIDEAHKLEEQIRLSNQGTINFDSLMSALDKLNYLMEDDDFHDLGYELKAYTQLNKTIKKDLINLAVVLRSNARYMFNKHSKKEGIFITDCDKLNFNVESEPIQKALVHLNHQLRSLNEILDALPETKSYQNVSNYLKKLIKIFADIEMGKKATCVYWVRYVNDKKIELCYTLKDLSSYFNKIFEKKRPVVFTSATITTNGQYDHLLSSLGIKENDVALEYPIKSPFNYKDNSLFYYDDAMVSPTDPDREKYIAELAVKIANLITLTEGKALVLFTSKSDMNAVYNIVKNLGLKENVFLQEESDVIKCREQFLNEENSCLFATGAFWEGMDFPGKTLSNLIIAKLPFPVQDPVVEYKKSLLPKEESFKVDLDEMLMKLAQGTGRLIRSADDTGIVCCLDSRTPKYLKEIKKSLPFETYTSDLDELVAFAESKIVDRDGGKQFIMHPVEKKEGQ